ncbi:MAG: hypothetical protein ACLQK8_31205 [Streptosporangiaceae bacterium]
MVRNVETGRFERGLSALTAAGALVTAAEIFFEHDSASFGNKMMWLPVALGPAGAAAGVAGFFSRRMAKTALPVASAIIVANGLQGTCTGPAWGHSASSCRCRTTGSPWPGRRTGTACRSRGSPTRSATTTSSSCGRPADYLAAGGSRNGS